MLEFKSFWSVVELCDWVNKNKIKPFQIASNNAGQHYCHHTVYYYTEPLIKNQGQNNDPH